MNIYIRQADEDDCVAIVALIQEFAVFQKSADKVTITVEQMKGGKELFKCFVAENEQQEIIGFATYFYTYYSWTGKALYLDDLYVKGSCRGNGVGTQLFNAVIDLAKNSNCIKLRWQVSNWNKNAIGFYKKMGAVIDEVEINCDLVF